MSVFVGTSGWAYAEWQPDFYPEGLRKNAYLEYYGTRLGACEVNATFYRLQSPSTFEKWAAAVPDTFRFAVKMHRRLTHSATFMESPEDTEFLLRFLESVEPLGDRLGPILVQLPPSRRIALEPLRRLLDTIGPNRVAACEFRNDSWHDPSVDALLAEHSSTRCIADHGGGVPTAFPEGPVAYVRMRGEHYSDAQRAAWQSLMGSEARTRDVFIFTKHEGVPAGNPNAGIGLADWFSSAARRERPQGG